MPIKLKFHSWIQTGLSLAASGQTTAAGFPDRDHQAAVNVGLRLKDVAGTFSQTFSLRGPGDVIHLDPGQIVRVHPKPNTQDFAPNYFPFVELASPELPWLFTPAGPGKENRICPWLTLVVLEAKADFDVVRSNYGSGRVLKINSGASALLPRPADTFAWSHVQDKSDGTAPSQEEGIRISPESYLARIMCPIHLKQNVNYRAFLIPVFEAGRLAGLGRGDEAASAGFAAAWSDTTDSLELPISYTWTFKTGTADFEALVRRIKPYALTGTAGLHDLDISQPRGGLNQDELGAGSKRFFLSFQGVLTSLIATPNAWPTAHKTAFQTKLSSVLIHDHAVPQAIREYDALRDDPVVSPPLYGEWQTPKRQTRSVSTLPEWMKEINLNPTHRAAAGLGTQVVRKHQEEFMAKAWEIARNANQAQRESRQTLGLAGWRLDAWYTSLWTKRVDRS